MTFQLLFVSKTIKKLEDNETLKFDRLRAEIRKEYQILTIRNHFFSIVNLFHKRLDMLTKQIKQLYSCFLNIKS